MMAKSGSRRRVPLLSHGRPLVQRKTAAKSAAAGAGEAALGAPSLSSRAGRRAIRQHHTLHKRLTAALARGDAEAAAALRQAIDDEGGLERYQRASVAGQSRRRGGDASRVLVEWLEARALGEDGRSGGGTAPRKLRMLDVGALTADTAASRCRLFGEVVRIDLRSQDPRAIEQQDFMARPLPAGDAERFDVVSLSLVLNYVPDARARGAMLRRVGRFLRRRSGEDADESSGKGYVSTPYLFVVLPAPCLLNSRYLTAARFEQMLAALGYAVVECKTSAKLVYWLCSLTRPMDASIGDTVVGAFPKKIINEGKGRNNFAIILENG